MKSEIPLKDIQRYVPPNEHPFWVEIFWHERGVGEDGVEVQRIEGYGFSTEVEMRQFILDVLYKEGKERVESFNVHYHKLP